MKHRLKVLLSLALVLAALLSVAAPAQAAGSAVIKVNDINIMVDNRIFAPLDVNGQPARVFEYNGTTYAPLRALAEAYGLSVGYSQELRCAYVYETDEPDLSGVSASDAAEIVPVETSGTTQLIVKPINIVVNGELFKPTDVNGNPVAVFETGGTTYAPLRALAEAYGLEVGYNAEKRLAYVTRPGETAAFTTLADGSTFVAPEIEQPRSDGTLVQLPTAYFSRTTVPLPYLTYDNEDNVDYIFSDMVQAYIDLLVNEFGFTVREENPGYVYNTWSLVIAGSDKDVETDEYIKSDVYITHYYDSDYHDYTLSVELDEETVAFADLGYRCNGGDVEPYAGERATDSYILRDGYYMNASDEILSVLAGERDASTYSYTKSFSSYFYTYTSVNGLCRLIVNGSELESHSALLCDFENFDSDKNDMLIVWNDDGTDLLKLRWSKDAYKGGETYNLGDLLIDTYGDIDIDYNGTTYDIDSVDALTVRPLWLDRTGATESLVYFYIEIGDGEGATVLTLEGLVAAPFNLAENSEWTSTLSGSGSSSSGVPDADDPNVADFARLDCLTCRGDGDCNSCGGSGNDYYGGFRTKCNTCYGSGNCRTCGGSGKRG